MQESCRTLQDEEKMQLLVFLQDSGSEPGIGQWILRFLGDSHGIERGQSTSRPVDFHRDGSRNASRTSFLEAKSPVSASRRQVTLTNGIFPRRLLSAVRIQPLARERKGLFRSHGFWIEVNNILYLLLEHLLPDAITSESYGCHVGSAVRRSSLPVADVSR